MGGGGENDNMNLKKSVPLGVVIGVQGLKGATKEEYCRGLLNNSEINHK